MTKGLSVTGAGPTAADTVTQIGSDITLPAGGPWTIHHVWAQVARVTTIPNQGTGGYLLAQALSGDLVPDPAPGRYPLIGAPISESANSAVAAVPLNLWPVEWRAAGKAVISLSYLADQAITTASIVAAGILFGENRPAEKPLIFCDSVQSDFASASEQSIGTITLSEKAKRIVGILCDLNKADAATAGEAVAATVRLASSDVQIQPLTLPCNRAFNASDGTAVGQSATPQSQFIPLDIPVQGGARIDVFGTTTVSVTGNASLRVHLAYE